MRSFAPIVFLVLGAFSGCAPAFDTPVSTPLITAPELKLARLIEEGTAYAGVNKNLDALASYEKALYLEPNQFKVQANLATVYERLELWDSSLAIIQKLIPLTYKSHRQSVAAIEQLKAQQAAAALVTTQQPVVKAPFGTVVSSGAQNPVSYHLLLMAKARIYAAQGDFNAAIRQFVEALDVSSDIQAYDKMALILQSLSVLYFKSGADDEALCFASSAASTNPSAPVQFYYTRLLLAADKASDAKTYLLQNATLQTDPTYWLLLAQSEYALQDYNSSYRYIERSIEVVGRAGVSPPELLPLRYLLLTKKLQGKITIEESVMEDLEETWQDSKETLLQYATIYWPSNLTLDFTNETSKFLE